MSDSTIPLCVPVTVIGGFLGTGKTTLLNRVLRESHGVRYAVLVNDFGEINIDTQLTTSHSGETVSFANGCVCCSLGDNLVDTIDRLLGSDAPPDQFLIEASGVANPRNIADIAILHPELRRDLIVVTADVTTVNERAADSRLADTVSMQLDCADLIVLNKCDLASDLQIQTTHETLKSQSSAAIVVSVQADIPLALLSASYNDSDVCLAPPITALDRSHTTLDRFNSVTVELPNPIAVSKLSTYLNQQGPDLLRAKGFVRNSENQDAMTLVQLSGSRFESTIINDSPVATHSCNLVLIGLGTLPSPDQIRSALDESITTP